MHVLVLLALQFSVCFANDIYRSSLAARLVHFEPVSLNQPEKSKRETALEAARAQHARLERLLAKKELQFMMVFPAGAAAEIVDYGTHYHRMMPEILAGAVVSDLTDFEIRVAQRFGLSPEQVAREMDALLELARLNLKKPSAGALLEVLHQNALGLGAQFQKIMVAEMIGKRGVSAPRADLVGEARGAEVLGAGYRNLARHLNRAVDLAKRALCKFPTDEIGRAWLSAEPPAVVKPEGGVIVIATDVAAETAPVEAVNTFDPNELRAFVQQKACGSVLDQLADESEFPRANIVDR